MSPLLLDIKGSDGFSSSSRGVSRIEDRRSGSKIDVGVYQSPVASMIDSVGLEVWRVGNSIVQRRLHPLKAVIVGNRPRGCV